MAYRTELAELTRETIDLAMMARTFPREELKSILDAHAQKRGDDYKHYVRSIYRLVCQADLKDA